MSRLSITKIDKRWPIVAKRLRAYGEPKEAILEMLFMFAFVRGEVDKLKEGKQEWKDRV